MTSTGPAFATTTLRAKGFSCPSCVKKIEKQVGRTPGVEKVDVSYASARINIDYDPTAITVDGLVAAVARAGYESAPAPF